MKISCPACGCKFVLEDYIRDQGALAVMKLPREFGKNWAIALEYCQLFNLGSPLKWNKLFRRLSEVLAILQAEKFTFQRRDYAISADGMAEALHLVCNQNLAFPLTSHGYLRKVMITIAEEEAKKRRIDEDKKSREKHEARERTVGAGVDREPRRVHGEGGETTVGDGLERVAGLPEKVRSLLDTIG